MRPSTAAGKRAFSAHIVRPEDGYEGPVIVKTERNYGGRPEARFAARRSVWARAVGHAKRKLPWRLVHELPAEAYPIFASPREVPPGVWRNPNLLVQRLLCERHGDLYALRRWTFLGDCEIHNISFGTTPIVKASKASVIPRNRTETNAKTSSNCGTGNYWVPKGNSPRVM